MEHGPKGKEEPKDGRRQRKERWGGTRADSEPTRRAGASNAQRGSPFAGGLARPWRRFRRPPCSGSTAPLSREPANKRDHNRDPPSACKQEAGATAGNTTNSDSPTCSTTSPAQRRKGHQSTKSESVDTSNHGLEFRTNLCANVDRERQLVVELLEQVPERLGALQTHLRHTNQGKAQEL